MNINCLLRLINCVRRPIVIQVGYDDLSFQSKAFNKKLDEEAWNPDSLGGDAWCIQSFCLNYSQWLADFQNSYSILYSSELAISAETLLLKGVKFRNLYRVIAFAKGTPFDWGLYFAKYFRCSLIIHVKNPRMPIDANIRPEDTLDKVLRNSQFKSLEKSLNLIKLNQSLLYMTD